MNRICEFSFSLLLLLSPGVSSICRTQSLAEVARLEAERRQKIAEQGIEVKRLRNQDGVGARSGAAISLSQPVARSPADAARTRAEPRPALSTFQSRLQKLDRDIAQADAKLKILKARVDAERWAPVKTSKGSLGSGPSSAQNQLRWQLLDLEGQLSTMRKERGDIFLEGRKAGYLPGELEKRGIVR
jgi:hypothetical protein